MLAEFKTYSLAFDVQIDKYLTQFEYSRHELLFSHFPIMYLRNFYKLFIIFCVLISFDDDAIPMNDKLNSSSYCLSCRKDFNVCIGWLVLHALSSNTLAIMWLLWAKDNFKYWRFLRDSALRSVRFISVHCRHYGRKKKSTGSGMDW